MSIGFAVNILRNGVFQALLMAAPLLLVGMVVGLVISIFQATTSIQEQTLTFVPKIAAILGALILLGPWLITSMVQFAMKVFDLIPDMAG